MNPNEQQLTDFNILVEWFAPTIAAWSLHRRGPFYAHLSLGFRTFMPTEPTSELYTVVFDPILYESMLHKARDFIRSLDRYRRVTEIYFNFVTHTVEFHVSEIIKVGVAKPFYPIMTVADYQCTGLLK